MAALSENTAEDTSAVTATPQHPRQRPAGQQPSRVPWVRPDFEAFDTALEVTAYSARD